jgi:catechol 2,3-dioxygenase-like lactoylglutathione lyase family enzyme
MTVQRMDHVGVVVDDLADAVAFFVELGLELRGETVTEGEWVDRIIALEGVRAQIAMLETPDGHGRLELVQFDSPPAVDGADRAPANARGIRHVTFAVEGLDDLLTRLQARGAELVGEVVSYGDVYRLCYLRGPAGIILELAERISSDVVS